jgi:TolB protein
MKGARNTQDELLRIHARANTHTSNLNYNHRMKITFLITTLLSLPVLAAEPHITQLSQVKDLYPHLSPDGARIVFQSNRSGRPQIWLMNRDGSGLVQLTDLPGEGAETPVWSPDGRQIAYATYIGEGNNDVFVMNADGSGPTQLTSGPGYDGHPHWSADGHRIVFNSDRDTPDQAAPWNQRWHDIWSVRVDGSDAVKHTDCRSVCTYGSLSPDGRHLLYRKVDAGVGLDWALEAIEKNSEIYLADRDGSNARKLASHPAFDGWPLWSPDGAWIVFASNRTGPALTGQLWLVRPDGEGLRQITFGDWGHAQPSMTAAGDAVLAYRFQEHADWEYGGITLIPLPEM